MAGVATVEEILRLDPDRYNISIFGKEPLPNYNRVLLGEILTEEKKVEDITLNPFDWYDGEQYRTALGLQGKRDQ